MERYSKKNFFFLVYILNIFGFYIKGFIITRSLVIFSINKFNFIFLINFFKYNLLANFSSLLDMIVVDNVNTNQNRFEITYMF
jgi:hypothetical protein